MKIHAIHDAHGEILQMIVSPAKGPQGSVALPAGSAMTEVEAPDLSIDATKPESLERLATAVRTYKVDTTSRRLVRKG